MHCTAWITADPQAAGARTVPSARGQEAAASPLPVICGALSAQSTEWLETGSQSQGVWEGDLWASVVLRTRSEALSPRRKQPLMRIAMAWLPCWETQFRVRGELRGSLSGGPWQCGLSNAKDRARRKGADFCPKEGGKLFSQHHPPNWHLMRGRALDFPNGPQGGRGLAPWALFGTTRCVIERRVVWGSGPFRFQGPETCGRL